MDSTILGISLKTLLKRTARHLLYLHLFERIGIPSIPSHFQALPLVISSTYLRPKLGQDSGSIYDSEYLDDPFNGRSQYPIRSCSIQRPNV